MGICFEWQCLIKNDLLLFMHGRSCLHSKFYIQSNTRVFKYGKTVKRGSWFWDVELYDNYSKCTYINLIDVSNINICLQDKYGYWWQTIILLNKHYLCSLPNYKSAIKLKNIQHIKRDLCSISSCASFYGACLTYIKSDKIYCVKAIDFMNLLLF